MGAFLKTLASAAGKLLKNAAVNAASNSSLGKTIKKIVMMSILIAFFLLATGFYYLFGGVLNFADNVKTYVQGLLYTGKIEEMTYEEWVNDPENLYHAFKEDEDFELADSDMIMLDRATLERIFTSIHDYNEKRDTSITVTYEYKDDITEHITPEPPPAGTAPGTIPQEYTRDYTEYREDSVTIYRGDIEAEKDINGQDMFQLRWQPIVALAAIAVQEKYETWGTHGNEIDPSGSLEDMVLTNYFLSDKEIDAIIDVFYFKTKYRYDAIKIGYEYYNYDAFMGDMTIAYWYEEDSYTDGDEDHDITKYIPASAPMIIQNSYISYAYEYESRGEDLYQCIGRTYNFIPEKFISACTAIIPDFDTDVYLEVLSYLPACEDLQAYYGDIVIPSAKQHSVEKIATTDEEECPLIGVYVHSLGGSANIEGGIVWDGGSFSIPIYPTHNDLCSITPGAWLEDVEGDTLGGKLYPLYEDSMNLLSVSDGLSVEDIKRVLDKNGNLNKARANSPLLYSEQAREDLAQCLFDYQERTGNSVLGMLAIVTQEGAWYSTNVTYGWNFFNIRPNGTYGAISDTRDFANYKAVYEGVTSPYLTPCVNAFNQQINSIASWYWESDKYTHQNNYYDMIWNNYDFQSLSSVSHSYCPPYQDNAMPFESDSCYFDKSGAHYIWKNSGLLHHGWVNKCTAIRSSFNMTAGINNDITYDGDSVDTAE